ncbi:energy transducer TonB [Dongia sp.]|uniref:energy transducer TonB n=1 Tax=Dongia sp. TaxID=1977262 RepID=UPI0035B13B62
MGEGLDLSLEKPRRYWARWLGAGIVIAGMHVSGAAIGMMIEWHPPLEQPAAMPPAVMIDLQPVGRTPPPPQRIPPQAERQPSEIEPDLPPLTELEDLPLPLPDVQPEVEVKKKEKKKKKKEDKAPVKKVEKKPEPKPVETQQPPQDFKTATEAPSPTQHEVENAEVAAAPNLPVGPSAAELAAEMNEMNIWAGQVNAHLNKYKKYPRAAKRRNQTGSPAVRFSMDRNGYLIDVVLIDSSGHESLDEEAIDMFRRAEPLPPLPRSSRTSMVTRELAINFSLND